MEMVRCIGDGIGTTIDLNRENMKGIEKDVSTINQCLKELSSYWEGPAHDTFHSEFEDAMASLSEMIKRTNEIIDYEEIAYRNYMNMDRLSATDIRDLWNKLGMH